MNDQWAQYICLEIIKYQRNQFYYLKLGYSKSGELGENFLSVNRNIRKADELTIICQRQTKGKISRISLHFSHLKWYKKLNSKHGL